MAIAGAGDVRVLETANRAHQLQLHVERQRGGDTVGVDLHHVQALRLDEDLVAVAVGEADHLVLDRGAVARTDALDLPGVQRRAVQRAADDLVGARGGVGDPARHLARVVLDPAQERHHRQRVVARLHLHHRVVQGAAVDARRRAGLQSFDHERPLAQARGQGHRRRIAHAPGGVGGLADVDLAGQEGAGGQHHRPGMKAQPGLGQCAAHGVALDQQVVHRRLEHLQVGLGLDHAPDRGAVQRAVGLAAGGAHRRALGGVERAPLDAGQVGGAGHGPAQGVDLLDQVALADAADGRVAAHRAHGLDIVGQQQGARAGAGRGQRGLGAGVAAADHDDVVAVEGSVHGGRRRAPVGGPCGPGGGRGF